MTAGRGEAGNRMCTYISEIQKNDSFVSSKYDRFLFQLMQPMARKWSENGKIH